MTNYSVFVGSLVLSIAAAIAWGEPEGGKPSQPATMELRTPVLAGRVGTRIEGSLSFTFDDGAHALRIRRTGSGSLRHVSDLEVITGPWAAGATFEHAFAFAVRRHGEGSMRVRADVLDAAGDTRFSMTRELFATAEGKRTWTSASSPVDARFARLETLFAGGEIDAQEFARSREALSKSRVRADSRLYAPRPMSAHERVLEKAFPRSEKPGPKALATNIKVSGLAQWTDSAGGLHGIPMADVEIRCEELIGSDLIATTKTDATGRYSSTFSFDDGVLQGDPDVFVRIYARSTVSDIRPPAAGSSTYFLQSPTMNEVPSNSNLTVNFVANKTDDGQTVFGIHHALVVVGAYAGGLAGKAPSSVVTRFPTNKATSLFDGTELHILRLDRFDWDVIHHEYGHYFMRVHSIQANPGGAHGFGDNLAMTRGSKDTGIRLAWGEGFPTYFGTCAQQVTGSKALAIPNVGDTRYTDTEDSTNDVDLETSNGKGEDNEVSVMAALWDLFDTANDGLDQISLGDKAVFSAVKGAAAKTAGAAWEAIAAGKDTRTKTLIGAVLGQAKIAPELLTPADNYVDAGGAPPEFKWRKNGGGTPNPLNTFKIRFYKNDFSAIVFEKDLGDAETFTPTVAEWTTILGGDKLLKWVVEGGSTAAPATPGGALARYWSAARTIGGVTIAFVIDDTGSMSEEIAGVRNALQDFIATVDAGLAPGAKAPTMQLITFKDDVTLRLTTDDLPAMQAAVGTLFADGGFDCPEFGAQAIQFAGGNVSAGGTILFATDASSQPGVDLAQVIASLRARGITVNTILSGDCAGIGTKPDENLVGGPDPDPRQTGSAKPGNAGEDEGEEGGDIADPGQTPPDDHGNTSATATLLGFAGERVRGSIGLVGDDVDYFALPLEAGTTYVIEFQLESAGSPLFSLLDTTETFTLQSRTVFDTALNQFVFRPTVAGVYFLRVARSTGPVPTSYLVDVDDRPLAELTTGVQMFSTIAFGTGGVFLVRDEVNAGQPTGYESGLYNAMVSTIQPTVLDGNPNKLPRSTTLSVSLQGRSTNWRTGATVEFSDTGITVQSVEVESATLLRCLVVIDDTAPLTFRDVTVVSPLGTGTETSTGRDVIEVTAPIAFASILSVEPALLTRGETTTVTVRGVATNFAEGVTFGLGSGITIGDVTVVSPTELEVEVTVDELAGIGFRTATTSDGAFSKPRAAFVNAGTLGVPQITDVTRSEGTQGGTFNVMVEAVNTHFADGTTTASFGAGIAVLGVDVVDATTAIVKVNLRPNAAIGFRDVALTTGTEVAVILNGYFVDDRPLTSAPLKKNGKFKGCMDPDTALGFTFTATAGSTIKQANVKHTKGPKLPAGGRGVLVPQMSLIGPDGNETLLGPAPTKAKPDAAVKNFVLPLGGTWTLVIQDIGGEPGCMSGQVKIKKAPSGQ